MMKTIIKKQDVLMESSSKMCRLCLAKEENMVPIYDDDAIPLPIKIMACVNLEVYQEDGLPSFICQACNYQLEKTYQFKKKCEAVNAKLRKRKKMFERLNEIVEDDETENIYGDLDETKNSEKSLLIRQINCDLNDNDNKLENGAEEVSEDELVRRYLMDLNSESVESNVTLNDLQDKPTKPRITQITHIKKEQQVQEQPDELQKAIIDGKTVYFMEVNPNSMETVKLQPMEETQVDANGELKVFKCDKCPKAFTRRMMLKSHQSVHTTQRGFTCQACEKWFPTKSALIRHERTHTGEKPFGCNICHRAFAQKEILLRHLMTHSGQKPFQCQDCDKSFTQREALRVHMRHHQKLDPDEIQLHHCQLCPKAFCHASGLSRHLVTHTGKTYKCIECEKSFSDKSSLHRHSRIHASKSI